MILQNKTAVIFGAGGAIGSGVAHHFTSEGATVYLSGRNLASVENVAAEIQADGGDAHAAQVDALDENAVERYLDVVAQQTERIDVVFNAVGPQPIEYDYGAFTTEIPLEKFWIPINTIVGSQFITARAAARHMTKQQSGVIVLLSATVSVGVAPNLAGLSTALAGVEGLARCLATEWGPSGVRVIGVRSEAMPETRSIKQGFDALGQAFGISKEQFEQSVIEKTLLKSLPTVEETAGVVAFAASDLAKNMTGTTLNVSSGHILN